MGKKGNAKEVKEEKVTMTETKETKEKRKEREKEEEKAVKAKEKGKNTAAKKETEKKEGTKTASMAPKSKKGQTPAKEVTKEEMEKKDVSTITCPECETEQDAKNRECEVCGMDFTMISSGELKAKKAEEPEGEEEVEEEGEEEVEKDGWGRPVGKKVNGVPGAPKVDPNFVPEGVNAFMAHKLYKLNKELEKCRVSKDAEKANKICDEIEEIVKKSGGVYEQDDWGYAVQIDVAIKRERIKEKLGKNRKKNGEGKKKVKGEKHNIKRKCPCCGEETGAGSFFCMGHDGRVKGQIQRVENGKMKEEEMTKEVVGIYKKWKEKGFGGTIKEVCVELENEGKINPQPKE